MLLSVEGHAGILVTQCQCGSSSSIQPFSHSWKARFLSDFIVFVVVLKSKFARVIIISLAFLQNKSAQQVKFNFFGL